jgi:hypothetical protein
MLGAYVRKDRDPQPPVDFVFKAACLDPTIVEQIMLILNPFSVQIIRHILFREGESGRYAHTLSVFQYMVKTIANCMP